MKLRNILFVLLFACDNESVVTADLDIKPDIIIDTIVSKPELEPEEVLQSKTPYEMCKDLEMWLLWRGEYDCPEVKEMYSSGYLDCEHVKSALNWFTFYYLCRNWILKQATCIKLINGPTPLSCHNLNWGERDSK